MPQLPLHAATAQEQHESEEEEDDDDDDDIFADDEDDSEKESSSKPLSEESLKKVRCTARACDRCTAALVLGCKSSVQVMQICIYTHAIHAKNR